MSVRLLRLQAEHERLVRLFADHERIRIVESIGSPPERYVIEYNVRGLVEDKGELKEQNAHHAQITLGPNYPRERPRCVMLTPVFHPNIDHLAICTEDIGSADQTLDQTIVFIGEMITYQAFNLQSPRNGDAARWTAEHLEDLPLDGMDLVPHMLTQGPDNSALTFAAPAWVPASPAVAPATVGGRPAPSEQVMSPCANCGSASPADRLQRCGHDHLVCEECILACANCREVLCVLCEFQSCSSCEAIHCPDCMVACEGCQAMSCLAHARQCYICQRWHCMAHCARFCRACGATCCPEHLDTERSCIRCLRTRGVAIHAALRTDPFGNPR